jgi:hypothetical protein
MEDGEASRRTPFLIRLKKLTTLEGKYQGISPGKQLVRSVQPPVLMRGKAKTKGVNRDQDPVR